MSFQTSVIKRDATAVEAAVPTDLYRHFSKDGELLYVGISLPAVARLKQHKSRAPWYSKIDRITIERFPSRADALLAEGRAICTERPVHNIAQNWEARNLIRTELMDAIARNRVSIAKLSREINFLSERLDSQLSTGRMGAQALKRAREKFRFRLWRKRREIAGLECVMAAQTTAYRETKMALRKCNNAYREITGITNDLQAQLSWIDA
ncbi:hypothetical protein ACEUZ9_000493 [Paracoccus litorisediminis]|uniref:hypothetical protein n=1 Tax=Paracoccus litorisediminis TaxID=2006130 RepID=UPI003731FF3D